MQKACATSWAETQCPRKRPCVHQDRVADLAGDDRAAGHWTVEKSTQGPNLQGPPGSLWGVWVSCPRGSNETRDLAQ